MLKIREKLSDCLFPKLYIKVINAEGQGTHTTIV